MCALSTGESVLVCNGRGEGMCVSISAIHFCPLTMLKSILYTCTHQASLCYNVSSSKTWTCSLSSWIQYYCTLPNKEVKWVWLLRGWEEFRSLRAPAVSHGNYLVVTMGINCLRHKESPEDMISSVLSQKHGMLLSDLSPPF